MVVIRREIKVNHAHEAYSQVLAIFESPSHGIQLLMTIDFNTEKIAKLKLSRNKTKV